MYTILELIDDLNEDPRACLKLTEEQMKKFKVGDEHACFVPSKQEDGHPVLYTVYNETQANISLMTKVFGTVTLPETILKDQEGNVLENVMSGARVSTHVNRALTIVKNGKVLDEWGILPAVVSSDLMKKIKGSGVVVDEKGIYIKDMPLASDKLSEVFAERFFENLLELQRIKSARKVYNSYIKTMEEDTLTPIKAWTQGLGLTDAGYNPKMPYAKKTPEPARKLKVSISGCSSIPAINLKLIEKVMTKDKFSNSETLLLQEIKNVQDMQADPDHSDEDVADYIYKRAGEEKRNLAKMAEKLAPIRLGLLLGTHQLTAQTTEINKFGKLYKLSLDILEP